MIHCVMAFAWALEPAALMLPSTQVMSPAALEPPEFESLLEPESLLPPQAVSASAPAKVAAAMAAKRVRVTLVLL